MWWFSLAKFQAKIKWKEEKSEAENEIKIELKRDTEENSIKR